MTGDQNLDPNQANIEMYQNNKRMDVRLGQDFLERPPTKSSFSVTAPRLRHRSQLQNASNIEFMLGGASDSNMHLMTGGQNSSYDLNAELGLTNSAGLEQGDSYFLNIPG